MGGQTVILDSGDLDGIIKDATGEGLTKAAEPADDAPVVAKDDAKGDGAGQKVTDEADDIEGEDGLTPRQKRELTQKMQAAIGKKHRALKDAEEFAAEQYNERRLAEQRAEALQKEAEQLKKSLPKAPETDSKPDRSRFETEEKYQDALTDWKVDNRVKELMRQQALERANQLEEKRKTRIQHAMEVVPDYEEKIAGADYIVPWNIQELMLASPLFAEIGYHFVDHPEDLARLAILPEERAKLEFRRFESTLTPFAKTQSEAKANGKDTSPPSEQPQKAETETAPVPSKPRAPVIKPLTQGSATQVEKPPSERTLAEEKAAWQRKHKVNLDRRQRH